MRYARLGLYLHKTATCPSAIAKHIETVSLAPSHLSSLYPAAATKQRLPQLSLLRLPHRLLALSLPFSPRTHPANHVGLRQRL